MWEVRDPIRYRYWVLASLLMLYATLHAWQGEWLGDFWSHSARMRELIAHPFDPHNSIILPDVPDAEFSPYLLLVALVARALGLSAMPAMGLAAVAVLAYLVVGVRWLVREVCGREAVAFYFLLFLVLLWGPEVYNWSGFLNLELLFFVLPFPSTFAIANMFNCWALYLTYLRTGRAILLAPLAILLAAGALAHPVITVASCIGLAGLLLGRLGARWVTPIVTLGGVGSMALLLAWSWPYFDLIDLMLTGSSQEFHNASWQLYDSQLSKALPVFIGLPFLALRFWRDRLDSLAWIYGALGVLYLSAGFLHVYGLARLISVMAMVAQLAVAIWVAERETELPSRRALAVATFAIMIPLLALRLYVAFDQSVYLRTEAARQIHPEYIVDHVGENDVVIARNGRMVPTFAGRIIDCDILNVYWIDDRVERKQDVTGFFELDADPDWRRGIIDKYRVRYLLLEKDAPPALRSQLSTLGPIVGEGEVTWLIEIDPPGAPASG